jgi:2-polyprenyl-3-methyl-5-hydroxy-6-metoxy-1,4-benzoquinol methylase
VDGAPHCALCGALIPASRPPRFVKDGFDIVACPSCGLLQRRALPDAEAIEEIYARDYFQRPAGESGSQGYLDYLADEPIHRLAARKRLDRLAGRVRPGRLLDVGCASGFFLAEARERGFQGVGVDVAPAMTAVAREHFGLDVRTATFAGAGLDGQFDLVTMWDYIEHTTDPRADVALAAERLAPGGVLALSTGDAGSLSARVMGARWHLLTPHHHNFFFRRDHLRRLLHEAGLEVVEVGAWARWASIGYLAYKLGAVAPSSRAVSGLSDALRRRRVGAIVVPVNLFDVVTVVARKPGRDH